jgi:hypothetical protein
MAYTIPSAMPWPSALLCRERSLQWIPDYGHEASPPALDGTRQFGSSNGGGLWRAMLNGVQLRTPEHVKAWLAFEIQLRGGMTARFRDIGEYQGGEWRLGCPRSVRSGGARQRANA